MKVPMGTIILVLISTFAALVVDFLLDSDTKNSVRAFFRAKEMKVLKCSPEIDTEIKLLKKGIKELKRRRKNHIRNGFPSLAADAEQKIEEYIKRITELGDAE